MGGRKARLVPRKQITNLVSALDVGRVFGIYNDPRARLCMRTMTRTSFSTTDGL